MYASRRGAAGARAPHAPAGEVGGTLPAVLNAANEVAVEAFVNRKISFLQITGTVRRTMDAHKVVEHPALPAPPPPVNEMTPAGMVPSSTVLSLENRRLEIHPISVELNPRPASPTDPHSESVNRSRAAKRKHDSRSHRH